MKLFTVHTGNLKLDGGAMFGVVPKTIWHKLNPADDRNLCNWAMRCLLVQSGNRLVLIDNGLGDKQDTKFFSHYEPNGDFSLEGSLRKHGFSSDDITDVFLTHLHFDHCGGSVKWNSKRDGYEVAFKNATYWSNERHWEWAVRPNAREKASFLKENILPIQESGRLKFISEGDSLFDGFKIIFVNGHTDAMMLPDLTVGNKRLIYCADLIPSTGHVSLAYVMAYDTRPLITLEEKAVFLQDVVDTDAVLYFEHDLNHECGILERTERGVKLKETMPLSAVV